MRAVDDILTRRGGGNGVAQQPTIPAHQSPEHPVASPQPPTPSSSPEPRPEPKFPIKPTELPKPDTHIEPPKPLSYEELFARTAPNKPLTKGELEQARKKSKRQKLFSALGDGISAISNLYLTAQGSPGIKLPSLSAGAQARWDRWDAERKGLEREYQAGLMRAKAMDAQQTQADRDWRTKLAIERERRRQWDETHNQRQRQFDARLAWQERKHIEDREDRERQADRAERYRAKSLSLQSARIRQNERHHQDNRPDKRLGIGQYKPSDYVSIDVGDGSFVDIPKNRYNSTNIAKVYSLIPVDERARLHGIMGELEGLPKTEQQQGIIGAYLSNKGLSESKEYRDVSNALREMAGVSGNIGRSALNGASPARVRNNTSPARSSSGKADW